MDGNIALGHVPFDNFKRKEAEKRKKSFRDALGHLCHGGEGGLFVLIACSSVKSPQ